jgi:thiol-disulfide isomerase/thioredoxin
VSKVNYEPLPQVQFQTLAGQPFNLADYRGKVVLLNFWATWCIPCREEIPVLNAMQQEFASTGLKIVGASLEDSSEGIQQYEQSVAKFGYEVVTGGSDAQKAFGGTPLPTTYLIDREGRIRQKIIGARDRAGWDAAVKPLLAEAATTAMK